MEACQKRFGGESERMRTFIVQWEFMGTWTAEFPIHQSHICFVLHLLTASAAQWALLIIETNDSIMNNFMVNFRSHFRDPIREVIVTYQIHQLKQGNRKIRLYITKSKLITADIGRNEAALIAQFRQGLNGQIGTELIRQGVLQTLNQIYQFVLSNWLMFRRDLRPIWMSQTTSITPNYSAFSALCQQGLSMRERNPCK